MAKNSRENANEAQQTNEQNKSAFEKNPVVLFNEDGIGAVIVTSINETQGGNYRCRLKLHSGNYINGIFEPDAYDETQLLKGTELLIYEVELVSISRMNESGRYNEDYVYLLIKKDCFEVTKVGFERQENQSNRPINRGNRRNTQSGGNTARARNNNDGDI